MITTLKKISQYLVVAAMVASSLSVIPSASAVSIGSLYNGVSGDVECTTGFFTITNNIVTGSSSCQGSVTIPEGVTSIGNGVFRNFGSTNITSLSFPNTVTSIGEVAFDGSISTLQTLVLPNSLQTIGAGAFINAQAVTTLVIPNGVTSIPANAFNGMYQLTSLTLPTGLTTIGAYAFANASRLTSLTIPNGVTTIGEHAFRESGRLTSLTLPSSLTSLGGYVFAHTNLLTEYQYCGSSLSDDNLQNAGLYIRDTDVSGTVRPAKTRTCIGSSMSSNSEEAAAAAVAQARAAEVARAVEQAAIRTEILTSFQAAQTVSAQTFIKAGISGVTESNIAEVNAEILALPAELQGDVKQILKIARKFEVVGTIASEQVRTVFPSALVEIGLIQATSPNKTVLTMIIKKLPQKDRESFVAIKAALDAANAAFNTRADRLAKLRAARSS
jgi:hypothetical protein